MARAYAGLKLIVLALALGLSLAAAAVGAVGLVALGAARAGGGEPRGALGALDSAVAQGASHMPVALAVAAGSVVGLAWSRASSRRPQ